MKRQYKNTIRRVIASNCSALIGRGTCCKAFDFRLNPEIFRQWPGVRFDLAAKSSAMSGDYSERLRPYWPQRRKAVDMLADLCAALGEVYGEDLGPAFVTAYPIAKGVYCRGLSFADIWRDFCAPVHEPAPEVLEAFEAFAYALYNIIEELAEYNGAPAPFGAGFN